MMRFARSSFYLSVIAILVLFVSQAAMAQTSPPPTRPAVNAEVLAFALAYRTNGDSALSGLTADQKQQWAARIRSELTTSQVGADQLSPLTMCMVALGDTSVGALVGPYLTAGEFGAMPSGDIQSLAAAIRADTTDGGKAALTAMASELAVMATSNHGWQAWTPESIVWLAGAVRPAGNSTALQAASAIVGYFKAHFLTDATATKSVSVIDWSWFFNYTAAALSEDDRRFLAAMVTEAYSQGITKASDKEAMEYVHVMTTCGGEYAKATERIVNETDAWQARRPQDIADMVSYLRPDNTDGSKSALTRLAVYVAGPLCNSATTMQQITLSRWAQVLKVVSPAILDNKADIATKLLAAFAPDHDAVIKLTSTDVAALADALASVDPSKVQPMIENYLSGDGNLAKLTPADSVRLLTIASSCCQKEGADALLGQLGTQWSSQQGQSPLKWQDSRAIALVYLAHGDSQKAQEWATHAYEAGVGSDAARAAATVETLDGIADVFVQAGLTGKGKGYPGFAQAVVGIIRQGVSFNIWRAENYGKLMGTPETLQIVGNELTDAQGKPNILAARVLTWGHAQQQDLANWRSLIETKVSTPGVSGDTKALWLMIKAHALSVPADGVGDSSALAGKNCLEEALAAAQSEAVKLMVISDLADGYVGVEDFDAAIQLIQSVDNQFVDAISKVTLKQLSSTAQKAKQKFTAAAAAYKADAEANSRAAWLAELRKRLAAAQQAGDMQKARQLETILSKNQDSK